MLTWLVPPMTSALLMSSEQSGRAVAAGIAFVVTNRIGSRRAAARPAAAAASGPAGLAITTALNAGSVRSLLRIRARSNAVAMPAAGGRRRRARDAH